MEASTRLDAMLPKLSKDGCSLKIITSEYVEYHFLLTQLLLISIKKQKKKGVK